MDERYRAIARKHVGYHGIVPGPYSALWNEEQVLSCIAEAVAEERERCAKVCEDIGRKELAVSKPALWAECCAAAIRRAP